ncbi:hypothetical protein P3G55_15660 [Leptospira sp. 96542]|nr:hypothetical protein [Leptospira sp. 96542]
MEIILKANLETVEAVLTDTKINNEIRQNLENWRTDYSIIDSDFKEIESWIYKIIEDFLQIVRDVEDESELVSLVFLKYIELKSLWKQMNVQIQYQNFMKGQVDSRLVGKASLITFVLIAIEPLLHEKELKEIQEFLAKPIMEVLRIETSVDIFSEENQSNALALMEAQLDSLYADKEYLQKHIGMSNSEEILESYENLKEQVKALKEEYANSLLIGDKISFFGKRKISVVKR